MYDSTKRPWAAATLNVFLLHIHWDDKESTSAFSLQPPLFGEVQYKCAKC